VLGIARHQVLSAGWVPIVHFESETWSPNRRRAVVIGVRVR
jgi:hypothetical protein